MELWKIDIIGVSVALALLVVGWIFYYRSQNRIRYATTEAIKPLPIRPLSTTDRAEFGERWRLCEMRFLTDPVAGVHQADNLLTEVMRTRGYSVDDPFDRMANISTAYPRRATEFRLADEIATRHRRGQASPEELRRGFIHYTALFEEILGGEDEQLKRTA